MDWTRKGKLLFRWFLFTAYIFAAFWGIWDIFGNVPIITSIKITEEEIWQLPFSMSRYWDILFAPIWSMILILIFTNKKVKESDDLKFGLVVGLVVGLAVGLGAVIKVLVVLIKFIVAKNNWVNLGKWLMVKD